MNPMIFLLVLVAVSAAAASLVLARDLRRGGGCGRTGGHDREDWHPTLPSRPYGVSAEAARRRG